MRSSSSSSVTSQAPDRSRIIVHIYARTKEATDAVIGDIEKVIGEFLMDKVLDQPQDQQYIALLTQQQVIALCTALVFHVVITPSLWCIRDLPSVLVLNTTNYVYQSFSFIL